MLRKLKDYLDQHPKEYELLRYLIAGGLTTLLSMAVWALFSIAVSADHTVEGATPLQTNIGQVLSWIIAVLFAFWINRRMVFQVRGGSLAGMIKELLQFMASRLVSLVLFEIGLFNLLMAMGFSKLVSKVIGQIFVIVFNYVVSKFWIFVQKKQGPSAAPARPSPEGESRR